MELQEFLADGVFLRPSDGRAYLHLKAAVLMFWTATTFRFEGVQVPFPSMKMTSPTSHLFIQHQFQIFMVHVQKTRKYHFVCLVTYLNLVNHLYTKLWSVHHHWSHFSKVHTVHFFKEKVYDLRFHSFHHHCVARFSPGWKRLDLRARQIGLFQTGSGAARWCWAIVVSLLLLLLLLVVGCWLLVVGCWLLVVGCWLLLLLLLLLLVVGCWLLVVGCCCCCCCCCCFNGNHWNPPKTNMESEKKRSWKWRRIYTTTNLFSKHWKNRKFALKALRFNGGFPWGWHWGQENLGLFLWFGCHC